MELKDIMDEIQDWIFSHMLHDDKEFAQAYLEYKQKEKNQAAAEAETEGKPVYVDGFGYEICSLEVSNVYLDRNQSQKGHIVVAYKENARDFNRLTALERNIYFGELSKVANTVMKLYGTKAADYVSFGMTDKNFCFHIIPRYSQTDGLGAGYFDPAGELVLDDAQMLLRIDEIKKALNK